MHAWMRRLKETAVAHVRNPGITSPCGAAQTEHRRRGKHSRWSKPSKPVQCATDEPGPSTVLKNSLLPPPPEPETCLLPPPLNQKPVYYHHLLNQTLVYYHHLLNQKLFFYHHLLNQTLVYYHHLLNQKLVYYHHLLKQKPVYYHLLLNQTLVYYHHFLNQKLDSPHIVQQTHRGFTKSEIDWQDNAALQRPWLPVNSRVRKIPSREEGDGPSVSICFYKTLEDLGTPRPECQDVGTQTLPPGAGGDAPTPSSKIDAVCPERRVMAGGQQRGQAEGNGVVPGHTPGWVPQRGGGVDTPGPVSELQPSKAQNCGPMLNRGLEQSSKTKADHQPAHPPGQQVGSKLTYAQVLMMPPRKRAPPQT
ncbi:hypothetical protein D4764_04G0015080 [Takifugu flavidus]|uniref:Uncharacterized protein n=1 Tax=Takifugu flavidus TaxID=433684 RepID=A0A5C6N951_9TELE|nr:hypothetical protein D4764_04G0015080 [Takifugu flavidus]